ncbi:M16 family metallopeptidase [Pseudooctadecabacter jejudonensis]|uniref:Protease 3 n=1 Tax=Pseudooctadecabacter jejudonensis TaxID=1391910 RepID=A0A1Y5SEX4_9RHOB|nr:pitrilysin family protein [Pseudooctadecabacter jejudonensis]SLN36130.1 Protease 3 precursor [Pseudooctadecabacter jejudonensis]
MRLFALALSLVGTMTLAEEVTTYQLDNGMDVVVIEDHRAPVVVHMLWYKAGSADEPAGVSGIAHFLEHLLFKATENVESGEFQRVVAENGGSDNAFTSYDYTGYFQRVAADRLPLMMQYEADRMNNLVLTEEDIVAERGVILEERNQRTENSPGALAREQMMAAQYQNHGYGVPIIGWMHEMEQLDMQDALAFYDLYYSPNNTILVVAGDVEPDEVLALAEQYYGPIPAEPDLPERVRPQEPPQRAERRLVFEDPRVAQPYVTRTYLAPERDAGAQEDAAALTYLAEILGGSSFTSVLPVALQFDTNTAIYAGAFYSGVSLDDTTFGLTVAPAEGVTLQDAEDAMDATLAQFMEVGIAPDRMEALRTQLRAGEIYARDDVGGLARRYGAALTSGLTVEDVQAWPDVLQAVTAEDVMGVAARVLNRDRAVTAYVVPSREILQ